MVCIFEANVIYNVNWLIFGHDFRLKVKISRVRKNLTESRSKSITTVLAHYKHKRKAVTETKVFLPFCWGKIDDMYYLFTLNSYFEALEQAPLSFS